MGYDVIVSTYSSWYLDCGFGNYVFFSQSWCDPFKTVGFYRHDVMCQWDIIYQFEPTKGLTPEEAKHVKGGEVCMWGEMVDDTVVDQKIWPRAAAAAERLWSSAEVTSLEDSWVRLNGHRRRLLSLGVSASPFTTAFCERDRSQCSPTGVPITCLNAVP